MLRWLNQLVVSVALLAVTTLALAGEAGRLVFAAGSVHVAGQPASTSHTVMEGDTIVTGANGHAHLKTIDNGYLIVRPGSHARVVAYHVDSQRPANSRIKIELVQGVARSISGQAVQQFKENFRFNTPVAAIGVRGTDFTVYTDQTTSRVIVAAGGVVVSGFIDSCGPTGSGPCQGPNSRELFANQSGQLLQVLLGQPVPQLLRSTNLSPDLTSPPRVNEPTGKAAGTETTAAKGGPLSTAAKDGPLSKQDGSALITDSLVGAAIVTGPLAGAGVLTGSLAGAAIVTGPSVGAAEVTGSLAGSAIVTVPSVVAAEVTGSLAGAVEVADPYGKIIWGRWQPLLDKPANIDFVKEVEAKAKLLAVNSYFAVLRNTGAEWQVPNQGIMSFTLNQSEAFILTGPASTPIPATLENGQLRVDFANASFATGFDLVSQSKERFSLKALGGVSANGLLEGASQFTIGSNMQVNGAIGPQNGGTAAYIFQSRIDNNQLAIGGASWVKK